MAGRVHVAEKNLGHGASAFLARIPSLKNCRQMFGFPRQGDGGTAAIDHDHRLAGRVKRLHEFLLHFGQFNASAVMSLAFLRRSDAADVNDDVGIRRVADGFRLSSGSGRDGAAPCRASKPPSTGLRW